MTRVRSLFDVRQLPSGRWRTRWVDVHGQRRSATFDSRDDAVAYAMERKLEARRGDPPPELGPRRQTVQEYYTDWFPRRRVERSTRYEDGRRFERHILPWWGASALASIRPSEIDEWLVSLMSEDSTSPAGTKQLAPATALKVLNSLSALLGDAQRDGLLPDGNPCALVRRPTPGGQGVEMFWETEEIDAVLRHVDAENAAAILTLVDAGPRWGELRGLHRDRINLARGQISIVEVVGGKGADVHLKPYPKSRHFRVVTMTPRLKAVLKTHLETTPVVKCKWEHPGRRPCSGLVFTHEHPTWGRRLSIGGSGAWADRIFRPALSAAGARPGRVHDLRHTCASWLVQDGVSLSEVAAFLGHESTRMTERYAHLAPDRNSPVMLASLNKRAEVVA